LLSFVLTLRHSLTMISNSMLVKALCFTLVLGTASALCKPLPEGQAIGKTTNVTIESGGVERWYLVTIPFLYDCEKTNPVILSYHGGARDASQQLELSQMSNPQFNNFALAVYPQGVDNTWQGVPGASADDILFTTDILNQLERDYAIDTKRIWATGKSDGASFTNALACDFKLSKRIAAFAPVSGAFYVNKETCDDADTMLIPCNPGRKDIAMIEFHGEKDTSVAFTGGLTNGQCLPSIPQFARNWAMQNGLGLKNVTTLVRKDTSVTKYGKDFDHGLVTLVVDTAIGHDWPSTVENDDNAGKLAASFNATEVIVNFFQRHPLPSHPGLISQQKRGAEDSSSGGSIQPSVSPTVIPVQPTSAGGGETTPTVNPGGPISTGAAYKVDGSVGLIGAGLFGALAIIL